jgi:hypothetical protein
MLATAVALHLGCSRIVLCGVPMTKTPHFAESVVHPHTRNWSSADGHFRAWKKPDMLAKLQGRVRSMSGRTRDLLGAATPEWLAESEAA